MEILTRILLLAGDAAISKNEDIKDNAVKPFLAEGKEVPLENEGGTVRGSVYIESLAPTIEETGIMEEKEALPTETVSGMTTVRPVKSVRRKRSVTATQFLLCPTDETCVDMCFGRNSNNTNCYCDKACLLFGDCCFDFFQMCLNTSVLQLLESVADIDVLYSQNKTSDASTEKPSDTMGEEEILALDCRKPVPNNLNEIRPEEMMTFSACTGCVRVTDWLKADFTFAMPAYQLVTRCPETWTNEEVRHLCENQTAVTFNNPPVHGGSGDVASFRNLHCAMCHGRTLDELRPWNLSLTCPPADDIDTWIQESQFIYSCCRFIFRPLPDLQDAIRRCDWTGSEQNASFVWISLSGDRNCSGDLVTSNDDEEPPQFGGFGIFNEPMEDAIPKGQIEESPFWGPVGASKESDTLPQVENLSKQLYVDPEVDDPSMESSSAGTFGLLKSPNTLAGTVEPPLLSTFVEKIALPESVDVDPSPVKPPFDPFAGTFDLSTSPNAAMTTAISTQQTVEHLPQTETQVSFQTVSFSSSRVRDAPWEHDTNDVSFSNMTALGNYMKWCDFFDSLSQDRSNKSGQCHCPRSTGLKPLGDDDPSLMVPLSALFTLDPSYGVKVSFSLGEVYTAYDITEDFVECPADTIFMADTKRCEATVCDADFAEDPAPPCWIDSSDRTFPPEDNFPAVVSIEVSIRLYEKSEMELKHKSVDVRRLFSCFLQKFDNEVLHVIPEELTTEWTLVGESSRKRLSTSMQNALAKSLDFKQRLTSSGNKSSCREIHSVYQEGVHFTKEEENPTSDWYGRDIVTVLKFRRGDFSQIFHLLDILGRSLLQILLDDFTLSVYTLNSVIVRNFNQSADENCEGEIKTFTPQSSRSVNSEYWIQFPPTLHQGAHLKYQSVMMRNEYIYRESTREREIRGMVCQVLGNLTGYKNCSAWIGVAHSAEISNGHELLVEIDGLEHKIGQFLNTSSKLLICQDGLQRVMESTHTEYDQYELILNYTGFTLSLVALLLTFLTYLLIQTLRNLPGKIVMCFSLTMFSAILLFMVFGGRVFEATLCSAVAIVLHYLWLSAFLWVNTLSFDVSRVFSAHSNNVAESDWDKSKRLMVYTLYALGIPVLIVGGTFTEGFFSNPGSGVGGAYGGRRLCWIRNDLAVFVFYCPVGLTLVINLFLFVRSVRGIHAVTNLAKAASLKSDNPGNAFLFVKLSLVMGLSWLLFYLLGNINNQVLRLVCSTVNSLQGVFVFLTFVCNRRVWRYYRKLFRRDERSAEEKTAVSDTSSKSPTRQSLSNF